MDCEFPKGRYGHIRLELDGNRRFYVQVGGICPSTDSLDKMPKGGLAG